MEGVSRVPGKVTSGVGSQTLRVSQTTMKRSKEDNQTCPATPPGFGQLGQFPTVLTTVIPLYTTLYNASAP